MSSYGFSSGGVSKLSSNYTYAGSRTPGVTYVTSGMKVTESRPAGSAKLQTQQTPPSTSPILSKTEI